MLRNQFHKYIPPLSVPARRTLVFTLLSVILLVMAIWLAGGVLSPGALANPLAIDTFSITQGPLILTAPGDIGTSISSTADGNSILGGERDIQVYLVDGAPNKRVMVDVWAGEYSHNQDSQVKAWSQIVWDGDDNDGDNIAYTGLNHLDLTEGGTEDAFDLMVVWALSLIHI